MSPFQIRAYTDPSGHCRFQAWLKALDATMSSRVSKRIERLTDGNFGDHRQISNGLFELRMHFGPGYRVYCGIHKDALILILGGGDKSTQAKDILRARYDWNSYLEATP
jgi:putative addiction module killer protein